jgi:RNA polymerase sigma-70 factor (ECF subfamily)
MDDRQWLGARFEENRAHLLAVAHRMLGSRTDAEDAVQDTWLRLSRSDATAIESFRGWLTTAVARACLNILQTRRGRQEQRWDPLLLEPLPADNGIEPEQQALEADSIGVALLVVLDCLSPAERVAFVLHDVFAVPFEEIALVVRRSPAAARQLASRARRRVQAATPLEADFRRERELVTAFLTAARDGDFDGLIALLDPSVVVRADVAVVRSSHGAIRDRRGASSVAETFLGRSRDVHPALVSGRVGAVWAPHGKPRGVFVFETREDRIMAINLIADPDHLQRLDIAFIDR